jgi:hypothetical protein
MPGLAPACPAAHSRGAQQAAGPPTRRRGLLQVDRRVPHQPPRAAAHSPAGGCGPRGRASAPPRERGSWIALSAAHPSPGAPPPAGTRQPRSPGAAAAAPASSVSASRQGRSSAVRARGTRTTAMAIWAAAAVGAVAACGSCAVCGEGISGACVWRRAGAGMGAPHARRRAKGSHVPVRRTPRPRAGRRGRRAPAAPVAKDSWHAYKPHSPVRSAFLRPLGEVRRRRFRPRSRGKSVRVVRVKALRNRWTVTPAGRRNGGPSGVGVLGSPVTPQQGVSPPYCGPTAPAPRAPRPRERGWGWPKDPSWWDQGAARGPVGSWARACAAR